MNNKVLNFKKIRKMFGARVKKTGEQAYTTQQVQKILENSKPKVQDDALPVCPQGFDFSHKIHISGFSAPSFA